MTDELDLEDLRLLRELAAERGHAVLAGKIGEAIAKLEPGPQVFHLELLTGADQQRRLAEAKAQGARPRLQAWAPTLNEYNGLEPWQKVQLREAVDMKIVETRAHWSGWSCGAQETPKIVRGKLRIERRGGRRRLVHVIRYSRNRVDEKSVDVLGGKIPLDRLVHAGVIAGDDERCILRRADWYPAKMGEGRVVVDVYELPGLPLVRDAKR